MNESIAALTDEEFEAQFGRMWCRACGYSVLDENWTNHVVSAVHRKRTGPNIDPLAIEDRAYHVAVDARIDDLLGYRRWYRAQANRAHWADLERDAARELRWLLRLARTARRVADRTIVADWTEPELRLAWGDR